MQTTHSSESGILPIKEAQKENIGPALEWAGRNECMHFNSLGQRVVSIHVKGRSWLSVQPGDLTNA